MSGADLSIAEARMRWVLEKIAFASGWLLVVMMCVTIFDVVGAQVRRADFRYTKFQELEWHFHARVFSLWMGYSYTINAHPRVDSYTEACRYRSKAWIELVGCLLLALPYLRWSPIYSLDFVGGRPTQSTSARTATVGLHAPLDHQGHLSRRPVAGAARHPQRAAAAHRLPVRRHAARGSRPPDRPCRATRV